MKIHKMYQKMFWLRIMPKIISKGIWTFRTPTIWNWTCQLLSYLNSLQVWYTYGTYLKKIYARIRNVYLNYLNGACVSSINFSGQQFANILCNWHISRKLCVFFIQRRHSFSRGHIQGPQWQSLQSKLPVNNCQYYRYFNHNNDTSICTFLKMR